MPKKGKKVGENITTFMPFPILSAAPGSLKALIYMGLSNVCVVIVLMYHTFLDQIQYSVCYTSLHDACLSIRLRIRTLISG